MTKAGFSIEFKLKAADPAGFDKFFDKLAAADRLAPPPQLQVQRADGSVVDLPPGTIVVDGILTRSKVQRARDRRTATALKRAERRRLRFARRARASKAGKYNEAMIRSAFAGIDRGVAPPLDYSSVSRPPDPSSWRDLL